MTHFCLIFKRGFLWVLDGGSHRGRPWYYSSDAGVVKISVVFRAGTIQTHDKNRASNFFSLYPFYMSSHDCPANSMGPYLKANIEFPPVERRSRADFGFAVCFFFSVLKTLCLSFFLRCSFQHLFYQVGFKSSPFSPPIFLKNRHPYAGCISILSGSRDHQKQIAFQPWKWKDRWIPLYLHCDFKNPQTLKFENSMEKFPQGLILSHSSLNSLAFSSFWDDRISICQNSGL